MLSLKSATVPLPLVVSSRIFPRRFPVSRVAAVILFIDPSEIAQKPGAAASPAAPLALPLLSSSASASAAACAASSAASASSCSASISANSSAKASALRRFSSREALLRAATSDAAAALL